MKLFQIPILLFCICCISSCKEEYHPKVHSSEQSVLVVEGVLNPNGNSTIRLTRSFKLDDTARLKPETGARVQVESINGAAFPLFESFGNGNYNADQVPFNPAETYRLHITTSNGDDYASDYLPVLQNPPIDSINWKRDGEGIRIFVNTHNKEIDTGYYRWEFEETWETHVTYLSHYKMVNGQIVAREPFEDVFTCWHYHNSSNILLYSTAQLASNVVSERPLLQIPEGSEKISVRYSVLVRQFAFSKQAYEFYQLLRKNTETLGSIFDAQPSEISGNIHAINGISGRALGFITIAPVQEHRIFISRDQVPGWGYRTNCSLSIEVPNHPDSIRKYLGSGNYLPYDAHRVGFSIVGWYSSLPECTDCTFSGDGTTARPWYW